MPEPPPRRKSARPLPSPDDPSPITFDLEPIGWDDDDEEEVTQATDAELGKDDSGPRPRLDAALAARALASSPAPAAIPSLGQQAPASGRPSPAPAASPPPAARAAHAPRADSRRPDSQRPAPARPVLGAVATPVRPAVSAVTVPGHANPLDQLAPRVDSVSPRARTPLRLEPPPMTVDATPVPIGTPVPETPPATVLAPEAAEEPITIPRGDSGRHAAVVEPARPPSGPQPVVAVVPGGDPAIPPPAVDWDEVATQIRREVRHAVTDLGYAPRYASTARTSSLVFVVFAAIVGGVVGCAATLFMLRPQDPQAAAARVENRRTVPAERLEPTAPRTAPAADAAAPSEAAAALAPAPSTPEPTAAVATPEADPAPAATTAADTSPAPGSHLTPRQLAIRRYNAELRRRRAALARASARAAAAHPAEAAPPPPQAAPAPAPAPADAP